MEDTLRRRIPEGWGGEDYSPVLEAEQIAREAASEHDSQQKNAEQLWGYTLAAFQTTLEQKTTEHSEQDTSGHYFSVLDASDDYPDIQIAVDWIAPEHREILPDGNSLFGSVFFSRETPYGKDVLSYSMLDGPDGPGIDRRAVQYNLDFDLGSLPDLNADLYRYSTDTSIDGGYPLTNAEVFSAIGFAEQATSSTGAEGTPSASDMGGEASSAGISAGSSEASADS